MTYIELGDSKNCRYFGILGFGKLLELSSSSRANLTLVKTMPINDGFSYQYLKNIISIFLRHLAFLPHTEIYRSF